MEGVVGRMRLVRRSNILPPLARQDKYLATFRAGNGLEHRITGKSEGKMEINRLMNGNKWL